MTGPDRSTLDRLLDALADEVAQRLQARTASPAQPPSTPPSPQIVAPQTVSPVTRSAQAPPPVVAEPRPVPEPEPEPPAAELSPRYVARFMSQIGIFTLVAAVLINIPFNRQGVTLATALPDSASIVIRDGLVVKPAGSDNIYVMQDGKFRWISSLDAFEHYGYRWQQVRQVEADFLEDYEQGSPLHVLLKCSDSPHIYRLEDGVKRWIVDIDTFTAEGHVWEDVRMINCWDLRHYPDGETIPPGRGPTPQP